VWKWIGTTAIFLLLGAVACSADTVALKGEVTDAAGKPIEHATVMIYHAGVKTGYSLFCPSCYADCGKRVFTDASGTYSFANLASDLWFELLVVREGYAPTFIKKVDPSVGTLKAVALTLRSGIDSTRVVRGRVVDPEGNPLRDVVVEPHGVKSEQGTMIGQIPGLDPLVVTNDKGEFETYSIQPNSKILFSVEARTMAPKYVVLSTGTSPQIVQLAEGAVIRGRLVADGKGVGGAEIGLIPKVRWRWGPDFQLEGNPFGEIRIGTQEDGTFAITNVPTPVEWYVYGKMESLHTRGATPAALCTTSKDKEQVDVGNIELKPGHRLRGKVVLGDGKPIPDGMRIIITSEHAWDSQTATLDANGQFEFTGLPAGSYTILPSVKGYRLPDSPSEVPISVERDIEGWSTVLVPSVDSTKR
jgi:uncharacterized GH25 family protein